MPNDFCPLTCVSASSHPTTTSSLTLTTISVSILRCSPSSLRSSFFSCDALPAGYPRPNALAAPDTSRQCTLLNRGCGGGPERSPLYLLQVRKRDRVRRLERDRVTTDLPAHRQAARTSPTRGLPFSLLPWLWGELARDLLPRTSPARGWSPITFSSSSSSMRLAPALAEPCTASSAGARDTDRGLAAPRRSAGATAARRRRDR